jgi:hypothetical protein
MNYSIYKNWQQVNTSKTKYLIYTPRKVTLPDALAVKTHIRRTDIIKYLGVWVTTDMLLLKKFRHG